MTKGIFWLSVDGATFETLPFSMERTAPMRVKDR
jgi:hypothetical protein